MRACTQARTDHRLAPTRSPPDLATRRGASAFFEGLTPRICAHYLGLALLYTINNQLTFYCFELADPVWNKLPNIYEYEYLHTACV